MNGVFKEFLIVIGSMLLIVIICGVYMYERVSAPSNELDSQLKSMVATHDITEMKEVSLDNSTYKFLVGLPKNTSINASDFQGGGTPSPGVMLGYFPAQVGNQTLNCYMVANVRYPHFIPQWRLVKLSIEVVDIDPAWADSVS